MYAIVEMGGRQYNVEQGASIEVNHLDNEAGTSFLMDKILLYSDENDVLVGMPYLDNIEVKATVKEHARSKKIIVFKKKRRKGYHKKQGHRQDVTRLFIENISKRA